MRRIIASLDVGSNTIKLVVGEMLKNKLNILTALDVPSRGIKKGYVVNPESAIEALKELFERANTIIGLKITKVILNVPAFGTDCFIQEGFSNITSENNVVTQKNIIECLNSSVSDVVSPNMQLVSAFPTAFNLDGEITKNPLNMIGKKLVSKNVVVTIPKKNINGIGYCLEKIGISVVDVCISPLADYYQFKDKENSKGVGAVINVGDATTTVSIINRGILTSTEVIEVGGANIDNDIAYVYKLTKMDSRIVKEKLALAHERMAQVSECMYLTNRDGEEVKLNQFNVSEIVKSRVEEVLNLAKKQINLLTKKEISYIILTGGSTELSDFDLAVDEVMGPKALIKNVLELGVRDNKYSSAVGAIKYYNQKLKLYDNDFSIFNLDEQEELSGLTKKSSLSDNTLLGKLFGYFFDN